MSKDDDSTTDVGNTTAYNLHSWMADLHSAIKHLRISDLSLPSAHHSGFDKEGNPNDFFDTCQDKSFRHQLDNGVRVLDIRLRWFFGYGEENINRGLIFYHSGNSVRVFANMLHDMDRFQETNPEEIVILDFHKFEAQRADKPVPYALIHAHFMRHYTRKMLPFSARNLTLDQIRTQFPGPRIIVAAPSALWTVGTGDGIPERDRTYFWSQIDHQWAGPGEVSVARLKAHIEEVMRSPPSIEYMWSMSATAYNIWEGSVNMVETLASWYPTGGDWQRKSNIINFDWCTRSNSVMIKQCIESNSTKQVRYPGIPLITVPAEEDVLDTFRPTVSGEGMPGATVRFYQLGWWDNLYGTAEVAADGQWSNSFTADVPHSPFSLVCDQIFNNVSSEFSLPVTFTLGLPVPTVCTPANGEELESFRPTISGEGRPGATVRFYEYGLGNILFGSAEVGADGKWTGSFKVDVPYSPFSFACDQIFNSLQSDYSLPVTFTLRLPTPTISTPGIGVKPNSLKPTVSGRGIPGATVRFFQSGVGITLFGRAEVDGNGVWSGSFTVDVPQSPFSLTCDQILDGIQSHYSLPKTFVLRFTNSYYLLVDK